MGKILEKLMKKYWKNVKNTGKVYEKVLENAKKTGKVREKSGKFVSPKKWEPYVGVVVKWQDELSINFSTGWLCNKPGTTSLLVRITCLSI